MSKFGYLTLAAMVLGLLGFIGAPASALPARALSAPQQTGAPGLIIPVKHNHGNFKGYGGRYHGPNLNYNYRYRNRYYPYRGYRYYRNRCYGWNGLYCGGPSYYYGGPFIGFGFGSGYYYEQPRYRYTSRHVAWCKNRYKSYKKSTNTWVSKSGKVRKCKSPYWP